MDSTVSTIARALTETDDLGAAYQCLREDYRVEEIAEAIMTAESPEPYAFFTKIPWQQLAADLEAWLHACWEMPDYRRRVTDFVERKRRELPRAALLLVWRSFARRRVVDAEDAEFRDLRQISEALRPTGLCRREELDAKLDGDVADRRLTAVLVSAIEDPDLLESLLARESNRQVADALLTGLGEWPSHAWRAIARSPIRGSLMERAAEMRWFSAEDAPRSLRSLATRLATKREIRHISGNIEFFYRLRDEDGLRWRARMNPELGEYLLRLRRLVSEGELGSLSSQLLAVASLDTVRRPLVDAVCHVAGMRYPEPLHLDRLDCPRYGYLESVLPESDLGRLREVTDVHWNRMVELEADADRNCDGLATGIAKLRDEVRGVRDDRERRDVPRFLDERRSEDRTDPSFSEFPHLYQLLNPERSERGERSEREPTPRSRLLRSLTLDELTIHPAQAEALLKREAAYDHQVAELQGSWSGPHRAELLDRAASAIQSPLFVHPEGVLGAWSSQDGTVLLYSWMIELVARNRGWEVAELETVALLHETAHAVVTHGIDTQGQSWPEWCSATLAMHEVLACRLTEDAAMAIDGSLAMLARRIATEAVPEAQFTRDWPCPSSQLVASVRYGWLSPDRDKHARAVRALVVNRENKSSLPSLDSLAPLERGMVLMAALVWACDGGHPDEGALLRLDLERVRRAAMKSRDATRRVDRPAGGLGMLVFDQESFLAAVQMRSGAVEPGRKTS